MPITTVNFNYFVCVLQVLARVVRGMETTKERENSAATDDVVWCSMIFRTRKNMRFQLVITDRRDNFLCDFMRLNAMGAKHPVFRRVVSKDDPFYDVIKEMAIDCRDDYFKALRGQP